MKKLLTTVALATALMTTANAGAIVDLTVGGGILPGMGADTTMGNTGGANIDLGLENKQQTYMYAEFDHFIPIIPNVRYEQSTLTFDGSVSLTQDTPVGAITFSNAATSQFTMDNEDYIAYWGLPFATWIPMIDVADFGLGIKQGEIGFGTAGGTLDTETIFIPYGYARLHVSPPLLFGLGFGAEAKSFSFEDDAGASASFLEYAVTVDWSIEAPIPAIDLEVGVEAGYKSTALEINLGTTYFDFAFNGVFFGAFAHFGI